MNEVGSERATIVGAVTGVPVAILLAATYPQRATALVLISAASKLAYGDEPHTDAENLDEAMDTFLSNLGTAGVVQIFEPSMAGDATFAKWPARFVGWPARAMATAVNRAQLLSDVSQVPRFSTHQPSWCSGWHTRALWPPPMRECSLSRSPVTRRPARRDGSGRDAAGGACRSWVARSWSAAQATAHRRGGSAAPGHVGLEPVVDAGSQLDRQAVADLVAQHGQARRALPVDPSSVEFRRFGI
jgi:pimeloyl-ACP methyl ester carboxylesterase